MRIFVKNLLNFPHEWVSFCWHSLLEKPTNSSFFIFFPLLRTFAYVRKNWFLDTSGSWARILLAWISKTICNKSSCSHFDIISLSECIISWWELNACNEEHRLHGIKLAKTLHKRGRITSINPYKVVWIENDVCSLHEALFYVVVKNGR